MFCPCGRLYKKWLEEEGLAVFIKKDMRTRQLCRLSTFSSGEDLWLWKPGASWTMRYLSILYEEEIKPLKKGKRVSVYHNIPLDITNCYTFCIKRYDADYNFFTLQKQD